MNNTVRAKGLGELRTVTTHHITAKPPRKGTTYLDLFARAMERQRLEQELVGIEGRRKRIFDRLADVGCAMEKLMQEAHEEKTAETYSADPAMVPQSAAKRQSETRQWKKMTVNY